jgi:hypothetical protein
MQPKSIIMAIMPLAYCPLTAKYFYQIYGMRRNTTYDEYKLCAAAKKSESTEFRHQRPFSVFLSSAFDPKE